MPATEEKHRQYIHVPPAMRRGLSHKYAASDVAPSKRYALPLNMGMWLGFLRNVFLGLGSCALMMGRRKTVLG